jgi:hypothetical protein
MSKELLYTENLIPALEEIGAIDISLNELEKRKDLLRAQVKKWLEINELDAHEIRDTTNQIWRIKKGGQSRKNIADWALLEQLVGEEYQNVVAEKEIETFSIKQVKKFSDQWLTN